MLKFHITIGILVGRTFP